MGSATGEFRRRLAAEWVPSFCDARRKRNFFADGFRWDTAARLSEYDARWFLIAVDGRLVTESGGFFRAPLSATGEQLFSSGPTTEARRSFTLWLEPIITIGALARLNVQFGWPGERMGCQSKDWGLDLMCYDDTSRAAIGCEVKKSARELDTLLEFMRLYASDPSLEIPPKGGPRRNAWKKVASLRNYWPPVFWAVGPEGLGHVLRVVRDTRSARFDLAPAPEAALRVALRR